MFVSVTRLRLRSWLFFPAFFQINSRCVKQIRATPGFHDGAELIDRGRTFWTVTIWESERAMKAFRGTGAHAEAMRMLPDWCSEAAIAHWEQESAALPSMEEAHRRLSASGRLSRVNRPNQNHTKRVFREPAVSTWRLGRLRPLIT